MVGRRGERRGGGGSWGFRVVMGRVFLSGLSFMHGWLDGWMGGWMDDGTHGRTNVMK